MSHLPTLEPGYYVLQRDVTSRADVQALTAHTYWPGETIPAGTRFVVTETARPDGRHRERRISLYEFERAIGSDMTIPAVMDAVAAIKPFLSPCDPALGMTLRETAYPDPPLPAEQVLGRLVDLGVVSVDLIRLVVRDLDPVVRDPYAREEFLRRHWLETSQCPDNDP